MRKVLKVAGGLFLWLVASVTAQQLAPIADRPEEALLPAGVSELDVNLNSRLAYLFQDPDGADTVHLVGDVSITLGDEEAQRLGAQEAVVWLSHRVWKDRTYRHIEVFLWRDARIDELAGTVTEAPALFVTLDTFGPIQTQVDEFAFESSVGTQVYTDGSSIRKALAVAKPKTPSEDAPMRVFDPTGLRTEEGPPRPPPVIHFQSRGEFKGPFQHEGFRVISVIGRVYLARGNPGSELYLEIQADSAVVFLTGDTEPSLLHATDDVPLGGRSEDQPAGRKHEATKEDGNGPAGEQGIAVEPQGAPTKIEPVRRPRRDRADRQLLSAGFGDVEVEGAYLEGDVVMTVGPNMIRASRLYYDFIADRSLILDAVIRTMIPTRNIPLYVRAAEIRQLSTNRFSAEDAKLTTSEFHTPHYHIGARHVELINRTPPEFGGKSAAVRAGSFHVLDATLNVQSVPIAYWPSIRGTVDTSETAIKSIRTGYSDDFGAELETNWNLFNLANLEEPEGFDTTLSLDYFSERGPAVGVDADYEREKYFGILRSYIISDDGEDHLSQNRDVPPPQDIRGRFLVRHRDYLADDWQLSLELSYISDKNFLEEYFEPEFDNDKDQETIAYLKKQRDNWAFTAALQYRILDFYTQTERLPDFSYFRIGEPLPLPRRLRQVLDSVTWFTENRLGLVRYRPAEQNFQEWLYYGSADSSGTTLRADTRQEVTAPFDVGPWRFVPFTAVRGTAWDESLDEGSLARAMGTYGVRGSMYLSRVYPGAQSTLFDIDGIHHVVKPRITAWASHTNVDSDELYPFDPTVEGIDEIDGASLGVRQRWQTKRGQGANRRNVDVFTLDTEIGAFNDAPGTYTTNGFTSFSRPENSVSRNYINNAAIWRINDRTALLNEINYDLNDGKLGVVNLSLAVERTPRFSYLLGYRFIEASESNLLGFDLNYKLTEKHTFAVREAFDLDQGQTLDFTVALVRKHPRWYTAIAFEIDEAEDDFGVSFTMWPEGIKQAAIGSRRFTGLANTTRIGGE